MEDLAGLDLTLVAMARPLMSGTVPSAAIDTHLLMLGTYAATACYVALVLARRRLLK